ncbi:Crp/Fnr family transcriptional regulator [Methylobacterium oxalidis]|uniref:Crp/Fnr family transcriptional regulator n=2 Tax=Methylobacterium oxalidis TaxID=944322 RepID=A0A512J2Z4_9HYPH|nr:Crp/Fnr family transcriptional regulator [Methylobacterium oxalidis]GJE30595.1 hypothetical protein LDDCCGHA_0764 [Methylobacterium oxalidis]GLS67146.1 Crp/Fnr family transcriptional regulator [Methylobacterium oxalidis]
MLSMTGFAMNAPLRRSLLNGHSSNPLVRKLEGLAPLSEADRSILDQLAAGARLADPHVDLIREGSAPDAAFLVLKGIACRYKHRQDGKRQILSYLLPGDLCDPDIAHLSRIDHALGTLSACSVARIPREALLFAVERHPNVAQAFRRAKIVEEAVTREWLVNLGCRSAIERIAHLFCELLLRLQAVGFAENDSFEFPVTQVELGDTTGLSNVHVNRTLQELRRQGLIATGQRRLIILDLPRLRALAEFQAGYLQPAVGTDLCTAH